MARPAPFAMAASLGRVDRDQAAGREAELLYVLAEVAAELVARHEGRLDHRAADAAVLVIVQVAAADSDRGDFNQHLARTPLSQVEGRDPHVARAAHEKGLAHVSELRFRQVPASLSTAVLLRSPSTVGNLNLRLASPGRADALPESGDASPNAQASVFDNFNSTLLSSRARASAIINVSDRRLDSCFVGCCGSLFAWAGSTNNPTRIRGRWDELSCADAPGIVNSRGTPSCSIASNTRPFGGRSRPASAGGSATVDFGLLSLGAGRLRPLACAFAGIQPVDRRDVRRRGACRVEDGASQSRQRISPVRGR